MVCFDESPTQLIGEVRQPIPPAPGQRERYDCEYRRNGTVNLFVFLDAHRPWRTVKVTDHRTALDFAACRRDLVDVHYPKAECIRVVLDNLSTHSAGALYEAFPAPEAHRVLRRLEFHHTPKHASWLNMVEIGVLRRQCLDRRIGKRDRLVAETAAWERQRNAERARIKWMFSPNMPGANSHAHTQHQPNRHNHCAEVLEAMGATPAAAIAAGALVGPAQVAARLAEFSLLRHAAPMISARLAAGLHPVGALLLAMVGAPAAIPFVLLHGAGNGMLTIARGVLPLALFGPAGYGLRTGLMAAPARILQGGAPLLFGLVLDRGGPPAALLLTGSLTGLSFLALLLLKSPARTGALQNS